MIDGPKVDLHRNYDGTARLMVPAGMVELTDAEVVDLAIRLLTLVRDRPTGADDG